MKIQFRYLTCFVMWCNLMMFYVIRTNVSVGIINMVSRPNNTNGTRSKAPCDSGQYINNQNFDGPFNWNDNQQGLVLSSFFIGYIMTHLFGSILAEIIGIRTIHAISIAGTTLFAFLMVPLAYAGIEAFIIARFMVGFFSGPLYPIIHVTMGHWAPLHERTILTVITHSGNIIGLVIAFAVGGVMVGSTPKGWEYFYYLSGALGLLNLILWLVLGYDYPEDNPYISKEEIEMINTSIKGFKSKSRRDDFKKIPFKKIFYSPQIYIQCLAQFSNNFIIYAYLTGHPKYLSDVYGVPATLASYFSMIAFVSNFITQVCYSFLTDFIRKKDFIDITYLRRINSFTAFLGAALFLIPVGFVKCDNMVGAIALLSVGLAMLSINQSGFFTAMVDLSPKYSGIIMGIANTLGSLAGIAQPQLVGKLVTVQGYIIGWRNSFIITACISLLCGTPFIVWGESTKQEWSDGKLSRSLQAPTSIINKGSEISI